jgi:hypothetical protein
MAGICIRNHVLGEDIELFHKTPHQRMKNNSVVKFPGSTYVSSDQVLRFVRSCNCGISRSVSLNVRVHVSVARG